MAIFEIFSFKFVFRIKRAYTCGMSNPLNLLPNNLRSVFRHRNIIFFGDLTTGVPHLLTEQVHGCVLFSKTSAVGMAEVVIFEVDAQGGLDHFRVIFHGIHGLDLAIQKGIDEREGREEIAI